MSHQKNNPLDPIIDKFFELKEKEEYEQALSYIRACIDLYPKSGVLRLMYGELLAQFEQFGEAILQCRAAVKCHPRIPEYYVKLGRILSIAYTKYPEPQSTSLFNEAVEVLYRSLEMPPENVDAKIMLSGLLQEVKEYDASVSIARKALLEEPDSGLALYYLGGSLYYLGELDEAERALIRAEEILPQESSILYRLARVLEAKGDQERAQTVFDRYKLLNPLSP